MPNDSETLERLSELGREMADVHLMRNPDFEIVDDQPGTPFRVGGWDVPGKYLADRKHRALTDLESRHVELMRAAAHRTLALQAKIDEVVRRTPPWR
jgi:hypothetical protein